MPARAGACCILYFSLPRLSEACSQVQPTKANGFSLALGFTVRLQAKDRYTAPRPLSFLPVGRRTKAPPTVRRMQPMTAARVYVACSGRPHHRPPESPIYVLYISLTCLQHATPPLIPRSGLHRSCKTGQTLALQSNHQVVRRRTEYS
jgi:hypothetical protein